MPKIKKTAKNITILFTGDILNRLIGFIATAYLARILGISNFGLISIGLAFLAYILTISSNGLPILGVRKVINDGDELVGNFISARIVFSAVTIVLTIIIATFFIKSPQIRTIILAYSLYLLPSALLLDWYFQAKEQMELIVFGRIIGLLGYLVFILIFVNSSNNVLSVAYFWVLGGLITSAFFILMFLRQGKGIKIHFSFYRVKSLFLSAFPLGLANLIAQASLYFPPILLGIVMTTKEAGLYTAAFKLVVLFLIVDRVFGYSFFPAISKCVKNTPERLNHVFNQTLKFVVIIAILIGFLGISLGKPLVLFIFGEEYQNSVPIFQMIMSYFMFTLINSVFTFTLIALKQERTYTYSLFLGSILFFSSAWFLLKVLGPGGMGIGLGIYQAIGLFIMENKLKQFLQTRFWRTVIIPMLISAAIFLPLIFLTNWLMVYKVLFILIGLLPISFLLGISKADIIFFKDKLIS